MRNNAFNPRLFSLLIFGGVALFTLAAFASPPPQTQEQPPATTMPAAQAGQPQFKVRSQTNAVVVHVVVRDSKGRAVSGLQKQDFKLFDNKKPQTITGFSVETPGAAAPPEEATETKTLTGTSQPAASSYVAPSDYLAFYFDDLYSAMSSIIRARKAAEKFLAGLPPSERVAIFTSSGAQTLDFTADRHKINEVLKKIHTSTFRNPMLGCPKINDYLASQIVDFDDSEALSIISDEAVSVCHWSPRMAGMKELLRAKAKQAYGAYRMRSLAVLTNLEGIIDRMAMLPGKRRLMVVSDGFINLGINDHRVERLVDHALRVHVTISALEGKGLAMNMPELNASRGYMPSASLSVLVSSYAASREASDTGTLMDIANGTGGQFFYNQNDLLGGMRKILLPPAVSYVLTFSPSDLKPNGSFHTLKVTLARKRHGLTVLARKGYFAPKGKVSPEELAQNEISDAIFSPYSIQGLPLTVQAQAFKTGAENERIDVEAQLGIRNLPFEKKDDRNVDNVVLAVGLFDHDGKYITGRRMVYALALKDNLLAELEKGGLNLKSNVSAKVGAYTLRVVVRDARGGELAALSQPVAVALKNAPLAAQQAVPSAQAVASGAQRGKLAAANKPAAVPLKTSPPSARPVVPSGQGAASEAQGAKTAAASKAVPLQASTPAAQQVTPGDEHFFQLYRRAQPITQWPLKKVRHRIPELRGLKPATDQSQLPEVLRGVSANLGKFVVHFVDTTAVETIDEAETPPNYGSFPGLIPYQPPSMPKRLKQKFSYLILRRQEGSAFSLVEYRTDLHGQKGRHQKESRGFIKTGGFAAMPLFFGPLQQPWSDFRYLGQQKIHGVNTDVVAFAEHPSPVGVMGHFLLRGESVPLLVQGVAWIRPSDDQILQMRTDLLAPLPPLSRMTAVVHLAGFQIQGSPTALWLPKEVDVKMELGDYVFSNRHEYSDYRLFSVKSVIKAGP